MALIPTPEFVRHVATSTRYNFTPHDADCQVVYFMCPSVEFFERAIQGEDVDYGRMQVWHRDVDNLHPPIVKGQLELRKPGQVTLALGVICHQTQQWIFAGNYEFNANKCV
jgi:hypothetical protein